jgi:RNA polymerase sigma factor for flagellar operon FliA
MNKPTALYAQVQDDTNALVMLHLAMVKRIASHLKARVPPFMELDELIQVGMVGLLEAARAFDPTKGIEFEGFAHLRVKGAMIDEIRRLSFLPRSAVTFNRDTTTATQALASELGRAPTEAELAEHLGKDLEVYQKERGHAKRFETVSIEAVNDEVLGVADDAQRQPEAMVEEAEFMQAVTDAITHLPEREQLVMQLYYVEELNLKEIGEVLGVSESRISQILSAVVKKLRDQLQLNPRKPSL